jgi:hypothetical protein
LGDELRAQEITEEAIALALQMEMPVAEVRAQLARRPLQAERIDRRLSESTP